MQFTQYSFNTLHSRHDTKLDIIALILFAYFTLANTTYNIFEYFLSISFCHMQWVFHVKDIWNLVIDSCYVQENVAWLYANEDCYTYDLIPICKIWSVVNLNHLCYVLEIAYACDYTN